jgi:hypothetical protein
MTWHKKIILTVDTNADALIVRHVYFFAHARSHTTEQENSLTVQLKQSLPLWL